MTWALYLLASNALMAFGCVALTTWWLINRNWQEKALRAAKRVERNIASFKRQKAAMLRDYEYTQEMLALVLNDRDALQDRVISQDAQLRVFQIRAYPGKWSQN